MLRVCLTFDYELFFGENYFSNSEILFSPTKELIDGIYEKGVSATFFVDVCSIFQHDKYNKDEYISNFTEQIKYMTKYNQDVQLHIHSHWLNSIYINEKWDFDLEHYRIHSYGFENEDSPNVSTIIRNGVKYLTETLTSIDPFYKCIAYRAGGFCLQPHNQLIKVLYKNGIRVDSSITPHLSHFSAINWYNYQHDIPKENWYIGTDFEWWEDAKISENSLYEIPIATSNKNPFLFCIKRLLTPEKIKFNLGIKKGTYIGISQKQNFIQKIKAIYNYIAGYTTISMDGNQAEFIYKMLYRFYRKHNCDKVDYTIALIGHPKLSSPMYVKNIKYLIDLINNSKEMNIEIISIFEEYNRIQNKDNIKK